MIWGDYHTHTKNSDGKGTLVETLEAADRIGLKQVGISDHGLRHVARGMHFRDIEKMRTQMEKYKDKYKVQCFLSIESNIYTSDGKIDLTESQRDLFDYVIAGYHKAVWGKGVIDSFRYNIPALFANLRKEYTDSQRRKYTKTVIAAVTSGKINILSHPNYGIPVDMKELAKAATDYGVYLELNGKKVSMTDEEVMTLYDGGVTFIVNSDAHTPDRVGEISVPMSVVDRLKIDKTRIVNWENLPDLHIRH
ncbi:MAG: PHP domain-containing protein [Corallococcus sp.]|nr:PHP domain-containing protein [Corallococcus sp.]